MATSPKISWQDRFLAEIADPYRPVIEQAFARWATQDDQWAWVLQALRDGRSLMVFQRMLLDDINRWGLLRDAVGALIEGALTFQGRALLSTWRFLVKKPLTAADLPRLYTGLDSWHGGVSDIIQQVRINPYLLIQVDRELLREWFPGVPRDRLRERWMRFLDDRWKRAPQHDDTLHTQWRTWAAVLAMLLDEYDEGHTYIYLKHVRTRAYDRQIRPVLDRVRRYLQQPTLSDDEVRQIIRDVIALCDDPQTPVVRTYRVVKSKDGAYEKVAWMWVFQGERALERQVTQRIRAPLLAWPAHGDSVIAQGYQGPGTMGFAPFDPDQQVAIRHAYTHPLTVLAAPPGTGKTAVIWALHEIARRDPALATSGFFVLTPTGRAARIVNDRVPDLTIAATTLHSRVASITAQLIHPSPTDQVSFADQVANGFVIVDEAFAADAGILGALIGKMGFQGRLVLIGDPDQVVPVSGGSPALDILLAVNEAVREQLIPNTHNPVVSLRINHRSVDVIPHNGRALWGDPETDPQTGQSLYDAATGELVIAQHRWDPQHFPRVMVPSEPEAVLHALIQSVMAWEQQRGPGQASESVWHVVTRLRAGAKYLNQHIRQALFPGQDAPWIVGDRVVQTHNDYLLGGVGLRNGDFGHIIDINGEQLTAEFPSGLFTVTMKYANLHWDYGYASTIHKAQGGEWHYVATVDWPKAWVPQILLTPDKEEDDAEDDEMAPQPQPTLLMSRWPRRQLYTGWTRARDQVLFLTPDVDKAIQDATRDARQARQTNGGRRTQLRGWLRRDFQNPPGPRPGGPPVQTTI